MNALTSSVSTWRFKFNNRYLYRVMISFPCLTKQRNHSVTYGIILSRLVCCYKLPAGPLSL